MTTRKQIALGLLAACGLALFALPAHAADAPAERAASPGAAATQPSLDDLLNIKPPAAPAPAKPSTPPPDAPGAGPALPGPGADQPKVELPKEKPGDLFIAAIADMKQAATMLGEGNDPGIETQRTQERAINRLNQLLDQLKQQQQQQSKSKSQQQDTGSEQNQSQQPQQSQQDQQGSSQSNNSRDNADRMMTTEEGERNAQELAEKLAEWGNLPDRIRDQVLQGDDDAYSRLYQKLTERYYQRLAEEAP